MTDREDLEAGIERLESGRKEGAKAHQSLKTEMQAPERTVLQDAYEMRERIIRAGRGDLLKSG
ncbi:hypothetical protein ACGFJ7_00305 [Actinoplanes sp. NPDC048988]|uniref:hypothetical protein n=1 Tax=Actinoplanes sp. NPDC048988 TaxID=3363901 RepID=UPI0037200F26